MKLLIATKNKNKLQEIRDCLDLPNVEVLSAWDIPGCPDVEEDGVSFEENAAKKAVEMARHAGLWALADDSGLEVDALDGAPGIYSARYAGIPTDNDANNRKLLNELADKDDRTARFRCVIALSSPDGICRTVQGSCEGQIAMACRGDQGFGYDPLFIPDGHDVTFAQMNADEKHAISHRGRALSAAAAQWAAMLAKEPDTWPESFSTNHDS